MLVPPLTILLSYCVFFFFNDTATTEIYTLSLHDALPIYRADRGGGRARREQRGGGAAPRPERPGARRRGGRVPRGAGRDRRGVSGPRHPGAPGRAARGGRGGGPHPPRRVRRPPRARPAAAPPSPPPPFSSLPGHRPGAR